jgi:hypothetical protein
MKAMSIVLGGIILLVLAMALIGSNTHNTDTPAPSTAQQPQQPKPQQPKPEIAAPAAGEEITQDYSSQVWFKALIPCKDALNNAAEYGFRGTSWFGLSPRYRNRYQRSDGHIIWSGDDAEIQTKMGDWVVANYRCEFDPQTSAVISATLNLGKLPQNLAK